MFGRDAELHARQLPLYISSRILFVLRNFSFRWGKTNTRNKILLLVGTFRPPPPIPSDPQDDGHRDNVTGDAASGLDALRRDLGHLPCPPWVQTTKDTATLAFQSPPPTSLTCPRIGLPPHKELLSESLLTMGTGGAPSTTTRQRVLPVPPFLLQVDAGSRRPGREHGESKISGLLQQM